MGESEVGIDLPLSGVVVLDFSQFLAGPVAAMRLADLGARVIKIERPVTGDIGRTLAFAGRTIDDDTVSFHAMNRNKEGLQADLKSADDVSMVKELVAHADVIIENFRPGVMDRLGLGYDAVSAINSAIIYVSATGYGDSGPWRDRPGQDLLAQAVSGLPWLNGSRDYGPVPVGISIADIMMSAHIAQGVTALLVRRARTGTGGRVDTSLLEGMLDMQFELLTAKLNDNSLMVERGLQYSANAFLAAPYGTYPTADGYLALAMNPVNVLGELLGVVELAAMTDPQTWWSEQDEISRMLAERLAHESTQYWLDILDAADVWCAPLLTLDELIAHEGFSAIDMVQSVTRTGTSGDPVTLKTTRSPIRIDGQVLGAHRAAPHLGEHSEKVIRDFGLTSGLAG